MLKQRDLTIENEEEAIEILKSVNYYNLINGYKDLFLKQGDTFYEQATLNEIYELFKFDRKLRSLFLEKLLVFENSIKTNISYYFSEYLKQQNMEKNYLIPSNFDYHQNPTNQNEKNKYTKILKLIADINKQISSQYNKNKSISHYLNKYGYVPLWVLVNIMTFGNISYFYSSMKLSQKNKVAKEFLIGMEQLETIIRIMTIFRNKSAHEERLYTAKSKDSVPLDKKHKKEFSNTFHSKDYINKRDLFGLLIALFSTLSVNDFFELTEHIQYCIEELSQKLSSIHIYKVLDVMGFPLNWKTLALIKENTEK